MPFRSVIFDFTLSYVTERMDGDERVMEKYTDELNNIELFRFLYEGFPPGKLIRTESPDFIVRNGHLHSLGIEITHVTDRDHAEKVSSDSREKRYRKNLLLYAQDIFEYHDDTRLNTTIYFREGFRFRESSLIPNAGKLVRLILNKIGGKKKTEPFHLHFSVKGLENIIESVTVFHYPDMLISTWTDAAAYILTEIDPVLVRRSVAQKEEKLKLYRKKGLRYYWLLLVADSPFIESTHVMHNLETMEFQHTSFHKVFLMERRRGRIFELN